NTTRCANTSPSAASASADLNGKAVEKACAAIRGRLLEFAATKLGAAGSAAASAAPSASGTAVPSTDAGRHPLKAALALRDERVWRGDHPTELEWRDLVRDAFFARLSLSEQAHYATPGIHFDWTAAKGAPFAYHVYGTAAIVARIDVLL